MFHTLNPLAIPIADTNLIEASAGTGKTWNIAALFTRLIVLEQYRIDRILVVTFTKAATAELKNRLRARLDEALYALSETENAAEQPHLLQQNCQNDDFLYELLNQALAKESQERVQLRLKAAISEFDNAAIYTIHGFCQRILQDFAFLCQVPFDIQLEESSADAQQLTAAQDFWRTRVANDATLAALVHRHRLTPQQQLSDLKTFLSRSYLPFRSPEETGMDYRDALAAFQAAWQAIVPKLAEIEAAFWQAHASLNGNVYRTKTYQDKFNQIKSLKYPDAQILREVVYNSTFTHRPFSAEYLQSKVKKGKTLDDHLVMLIQQLDDLTDKIDTLMQAEMAALHQLSADLARYLREQRAEYKKHHPDRVFDDLLLDVHHALLHHTEHADALAKALAHQWQVALIDEFQDTDPLQYAIFQAAFAQTRTPLFLVGDPKQAIYSFRGADIFAYLQAVQDSQRHYTLGTNHRSHRRLINSIGALFQRERPFVLPEIAYAPVAASRETSALEPVGHAVQVRWLPNPTFLKTDALVRESAAICAMQIADLLQQSASGSLKMKAQALHAGQIAILVRARQDGVVMQQELKKRGIQSVLLSQNSIFAESEAEALAALLAFMIQPQKTGLLRFVLASVLFSYDAAALQELNRDERQLLVWMDSAQRALERWQQQGIYAALQAFLQEHGVETRLLRQKNERALTNIHQIMELLAQEDEFSHTPSSLLQWLNQSIQTAQKHHTSQHNHHILRLESDEQLVKIVTMHAAKGLQYPVVFCPFAWKRSPAEGRNKWLISHESGQAEIISRHQFQNSPADQQAIQHESLSEDLRLLYVAMTRAEERLYVYVSHFQSSETSRAKAKSSANHDDEARSFQNALAYLLDADDGITKDAEGYQRIWHDFIAAQDADETDFEFVVHDEQAFSGSLNQPIATKKPIFQAHTVSPRRFQFIQHASFTSLSRQTARAHEAAELLPVLDADELLASPNMPTEHLPSDGIFAFPQGAAAGVCLHTILEKWFVQPSQAARQMWVQQQLTLHGFDAEMWCDVVMQMCDFAQETPLLPQVNLNHLHQGQMISEMNFLLHTERFLLKEIQEWFANPKHGLSDTLAQAAQQLHFRDVRGFLNGAIDLVARSSKGAMLIVDYKSNYLGNHADAYCPKALETAMAEHHYYLQAWIYAIATARYLQSRHALPEQLAVRYLFLRGLDGITDNGVWSWDIRTADLARWL